MYVIDNLIYSLTLITLYLSNCACNKVSDLQRSDKVACCVFILLNHRFPQKKYRCVYIFPRIVLISMSKLYIYLQWYHCKVCQHSSNVKMGYFHTHLKTGIQCRGGPKITKLSLSLTLTRYTLIFFFSSSLSFSLFALLFFLKKNVAFF